MSIVNDKNVSTEKAHQRSAQNSPGTAPFKGRLAPGGGTISAVLTTDKGNHEHMRGKDNKTCC